MAWVLAVLALAAAAVVFFLERLRSPASYLHREQRHRQVFYLAEAGVALQLHRERFFDSIPEERKSEARKALDSIRFFLDSAAVPPRVRVNREGAYLEIRSTAVIEAETLSVVARFGRTLDPMLFGPALTLANDAPLLPFRHGQVRGALRLLQPPPGMTSLSWPATFPGVSYADAFVTGKYSALETRLQQALNSENPESGNGNYTSTFPPRLDPDRPAVHPLGQVEIAHDGGGYWELRGPGVIASQGDIRVRGRVLLREVMLLTKQNLVLEGEVRAENVTLFAEKNLTLQGDVAVEGLILGGGNVHVRERARVTGQSLLLRAGGNSGDSTQALRIVQEARVSGFVVATGAAGRIVIGGSRNTVTGILMAPEIWPAGTIQGSVVASRLRCGNRDNGQNCLGETLIDREALPDDFVQPLGFGPSQDPARIRYKLLAWEVP